MATSPTIVFCFDGFDAAYLDRFRDEMPAINALCESGVETPLRSTVPPWTACAWPTLFTGVGPGTHGVYGFFSYDGYPDTAEIVTREDVRAPALWNYLTARDRRTIVLNMPVTYPVEPIEGIMIPGYLSPEDAPGHPTDIRDTVSSALSEPYRIYAERELSLSGREKLAAYADLIKIRGRTAAYLLETSDWDVAIVQLQKTDSVFHQFADEEAFRTIYAAADDVVDRVLGAVQTRPNVILCSDHGIGPATGYSIHVNELLREAGMLVATETNTAPSMREHRSSLMDGSPADRETNTSLASVAITALRRAGVDPGTVYAGLRRIGLAEPLSSAIPDAAKREAVEGVDWAQSAAYCRVGSEMGVRLNVAGREPAGVVSPEEYEAVRSSVIDSLQQARTPEGDPAFSFVSPREAIYDGPAVEAAPDVVFLPSEMNHVVSPTLVGSPFISVDTYTHKLDGVFLADGPAFDGAEAERGFNRESPHGSENRSGMGLCDVAPIVLASIGCPVPARLEGSIAPGLLADEPQWEEYESVPYADSQGAAGKHHPGDDVERHLEDLGYI